MAACQPPNQPPRRTRRSRAHTFRISQIPIAECAAFSAPHPPRVLSLAAFGRRPLVYVAPLSLAVIRNPTQQATFENARHNRGGLATVQRRGHQRRLFASHRASFSSARAASYCIVIVTPPTAAETSAPTRTPLSCRMTPLAFCNCTPPAPAAIAPPAPPAT